MLSFKKHYYRNYSIKMLNKIPIFKTRERVYGFLIIVVVFTGIYFYLNQLQQTYTSVQYSKDRCLSQLTSLKYQLDVVSDLKRHLERLLSTVQKDHNTEKDAYKDMMESCVAMKQQAIICQTQFEDLQNECKKVKEDLNTLKAIRQI